MLAVLTDLKLLLLPRDGGPTLQHRRGRCAAALAPQIESRAAPHKAATAVGGCIYRDVFSVENIILKLHNSQPESQAVAWKQHAHAAAHTHSSSNTQCTDPSQASCTRETGRWQSQPQRHAFKPSSQAFEPRA